MSGAVRKLIVLGLAPVLLAGCVQMAEMPPPALNYAGGNCESEPDLHRAHSLTPEKPKKLFTVETPVDELTGCLRSGGVDTPYLVFALPNEEVRMIEIGAQLEGMRIFSPSVAILDRDGRQLRTFAPDQYLYRGGVLSVQFVPQPDERYVLVTADPARIGKDYDSIEIGTSNTTIATGYSYTSWRSGFDEDVSRTFSWNGNVIAQVHSPEEDR